MLYPDTKYIVTGGAGFIGSNLVRVLNDRGEERIVIVDNLTGDGVGKGKEKNLAGLHYQGYIERDEFLSFLGEKDPFPKLEALFHLGAETDTFCQDNNFLFRNNTQYSQNLFEHCVKKGWRFFYASSAATYGNGRRGYSDQARDLEPLNPYGLSKHRFDQWVWKSEAKPRQWAGFKFFNVYGPNEYHKGPMASKVWHGFQEFCQTGTIRLFKSYRPDYRDGEQKRDFVYVKDAVSVMLFFLDHPEKIGMFNVGTGQARSFIDLAQALARALDKEPRIQFIEMPPGLRDQYQYSTQADPTTLAKAGFGPDQFHSLEAGIEDYVKNYLLALSL